MELQTETRYDFSPALVVSTLESSRGQHFVIRDDLLPAGTKQRALAPYLVNLINEGHRHFVYASPFSGFAQIALAYVCRALGVPCTVVCEKDQRFPEFRSFHPFSLQAQKYGAKVILVESLHEAEIEAFSLAHQIRKSFQLPLGFDSPVFRHHLHLELTRLWEQLSFPVKTLWLPVGSGTLARTFRDVIPANIRLKCVNVRVLNDRDERLEIVRSLPMVTMRKAPMPFHSPAAIMPEIPSNTFYDAKIWSFLQEEGEDGDLWWNVAQ